jgi:hypothetical protein
MHDLDERNGVNIEALGAAKAEAPSQSSNGNGGNHGNGNGEGDGGRGRGRGDGEHPLASLWKAINQIGSIGAEAARHSTEGISMLGENLTEAFRLINALSVEIVAAKARLAALEAEAKAASPAKESGP